MNILPGLAHQTLKLLNRITSFSEAMLQGFWLGVLGGKGLGKFNELHYRKASTYTDDKYNLSGLHRWEFDTIKKHFSHARKFLLIGAGGGRETAMLTKWGASVDSYECSRMYVGYANDFFKRNGIAAEMKYLPENEVPPVVKQYDGIILGWGVYTHIQGRETRTALLSALKPFCREDTLLMLSFHTREGSRRKYRAVKVISDFFRFFTGRPRTEEGDMLPGYFAHQFTREEIETELTSAGYTLVDYQDTEYGCAVARVG